MVRETLSLRRVTNIVPEQRANIAGDILQITKGIYNASQESKILNNISQAQLEINGITNKYRLDNQLTPTQNIDRYNSDIQSVLNRYGQDIGSGFKGQWQQQSNQLTNKLKANNQAWVIQQNATNAIFELNQSKSAQYQLAYRDGIEFGNGNNTDVSSLLSFQQSKQSLENAMSGRIGERDIQRELAGYEKNYMTSFINGSIEANPATAQGLLENQTVKNYFNQKELKTFQDTIKVVNKQNVIKGLKTQDTMESTSIENLYNPSVSDFDKRLEIDKMVLTDQISPTFAAQYKRVLDSEKAVDAITNNQDLSDEILKLDILNNKEDLSDEEYLTGLNRIRTSVLKKHSEGRINQEDLSKFNKELNYKTNRNREARALQGISRGISWGFSYNDAFDYFNENMSEEDSFTALRTYFNAVSLGEFSNDDKEKIAYKIRKERTRSRLLEAIKDK